MSTDPNGVFTFGAADAALHDVLHAVKRQILTEKEMFHKSGLWTVVPILGVLTGEAIEMLRHDVAGPPASTAVARFWQYDRKEPHTPEHDGVPSYPAWPAMTISASGSYSV
jgi:hypothetical protein